MQRYPWIKHLLTVLAVIYIVFPRDLLPDVLIGIGWVDDLAVGWLAWRYLLGGYGGRILGKRFSNRDRPEQFEQQHRPPPHEAPHNRDPYHVLGLARSATQAEIRKAYREKASQYHPDKVAHLGPEFQELARERFREIQSAYEKLRKSPP